MIYIVGFFVLCFLVFIILAGKSPEGWEDKDGFHYGKEKK